MDISKWFDKVWHQGLLYKLKQNGISGNLLETLTDFLKDRKQRVALNWQNSLKTNIEAGVPQGSILQSVTKIMGKTAIWTILCFSPLPPLNNVE